MYLLLSLFLISSQLPFLNLYQGGRQTAIGGAYVAIADDAFANFYNPAGVSFQKDFALGFDYNSISIPWIVKPKNWNITSVLPIHKSLSVGLFGFGVTSKESIYHYHAHDFATGLSFGYKVSGAFGVGAIIKYIHSFFAWEDPEIGLSVRETGKSLAVDLGFIGKFPFLYGKTGVGLVVQNIGPKLSYSSGSKVPLPLTIRTGFSYTIAGKEKVTNDKKTWFKKWMSETWRVTVAYDLNQIIYRDFLDNELIIEKPFHSFGIEGHPISFWSIRLGYFFDPTYYEYYEVQHRRGWTIGMGFNFKFIRFDISDDSAFFWLYETDRNRIRFSLSLNIGEPFFPKNGLLSYLLK